MTIALRYTIHSDVGLLREGNEDSAYAGPHLLVIADGMGGHAAGEVASAVAIGAMTPLDTGMDADQMMPALAQAVTEAGATLHEMTAANPAMDGMGTTLTALMWSGAQVAVCHIGDSRAYLLRDGDLTQITRDHTLVQSLVDEGRLTPAAAATHPQRSLVMRALQSSSDAEPDLTMREARVGDRYLLCSDGLSDVVTDETLHKTLAGYADLGEAALALTDLAIRSGGPDNITCVLADVVDPASTRLPPSEEPVLAGAAALGEPPPLPLPDSPARRAHDLTQAMAPATARRRSHAAPGRSRAARAADPWSDETWPDSGPGDEPDTDGYDSGPGGRRRWPVVTSILVVLLLLIAGGGYVAWQYTRTQYYVGTSGGYVVIYRGVNQKVAGLSLSSVYDKTTIPVSGIPSAMDRGSVQKTIPAGSLRSAQSTVTNLRHEYTCGIAQRKLATWTKNKPKPQTVTIRVNGKPVTRRKPLPPYPPAPVVPGYCSAGTAG